MPRHPSSAGSGPRPAGGSGSDEPRPGGRGNDRPPGHPSCASSGSPQAAPDEALHGPGCSPGQSQPGEPAASAEQLAALRNRAASGVTPNETPDAASLAGSQHEGAPAPSGLILENNDGQDGRPGLLAEGESDDEDSSSLDSRYRQLEKKNAELERYRRQLERTVQV